MIKHNIWYVRHKLYNDETNLYVYNFDYVILKTANKVTKILKTVTKEV